MGRHATPYRRDGIYINATTDPGDGGTTIAVAPEGMTASLKRWAESADFMVKAANMHDDLVKAVEHLMFVARMADAVIAFGAHRAEPRIGLGWAEDLLKRARG